MSDEASTPVGGIPTPALAVSIDDIFAARGGPPGRVAELIERYRRYLLSIAMRELPAAIAGKVGASDVVQDAIYKGYERFDTFQGTSPEELARWLRQILRNHLANVREACEAKKRAFDREQASSGEIADSSRYSPTREALAREERNMLNEKVARLPEHLQEVIRLRYRDDLSFDEIGRKLNRSADACRKLWGRAIKQLGIELRNRGE